MKKISNSLLNEEYFAYTLSNGLTVYLVPKTKFHRVYGVFATKFGSCDCEFIPRGETKYQTVPLGVAHFLEHKTFEIEGGIDASDIFAELGAETNAFTTYDKTAYMFKATSNINECIETLLDFVQTPYYTLESVEREQGIIEQELRMYLDKPYTVLYNKLLENMYALNHVRNDIGGTVDSIKDIDHEVLNLCFNTFYHPSNMTLSIVGNFDKDEVIKVIKQNQEKKAYDKVADIKRKYYLEDNKVINSDGSSYMDINKPRFGCGVKFDVRGYDSISLYKNMVSLDILMDIFFDQSSNFYNDSLEKNIISNGFNYETYFEPTFAHVLFMSSSEKIDELKAKLKEELLKIASAKIDETVFNRYKKVELANSISRFNSLEYIGNFLIDLDQIKLGIFDTVEIKKNLTLEDIKNVQKLFVEEAITFYTIYPKN